MDYKKRLELAKDWYNEQSTTKKEKVLLENLFPELAESNSERIRREIIDYLHLVGKGDSDFAQPIVDKWIAWLEKQGELKSANIDEPNFFDDFRKSDTEEDYNKIKPKFKIGDWITDGKYTWKITDIRRLDYILQSQNGDTVDDTISYVDEHFHLWTIDDAKDGDVLASKSGCPFIYKKSDSVGARFYCCVDFENYFRVCDNTSHCGFKDSSKPATKEQHDLLFQKMKEAGYEWDAEKKELKKIEQKPTWSEDDEKYINDILAILGGGRGYRSNRQIEDWLKALKPQPHWKPTQEQIYALSMAYKDSLTSGENLITQTETLKSLYNDLKKL